jgi:anthranilate phosphoribosyltransferase
MMTETHDIPIGPLLERLCQGEQLSRDESHGLFASVMRGEISEIHLAALLTALKAKGETPEEIAGAAMAMREAARSLDTGSLQVADNCGTGGDGAHTVNISTAAAIIAAEGGSKMAKHGNRSVSSRCGSADVLEQLGLRIDAPPSVALRCLEQAGICFLFAPQYHAGVRHAMPVRRALGVRTMFNLLGPLANPARPAHQLIGVYDPLRCRPLAETLHLLGTKRALVVHGSGLDEIALHGPTTAALLEEGEVRDMTISPADVGIEEAPLNALRGGEPEENATWLRSLLDGQATDAHIAAVAINAGAMLWISEQAASHREGTAKANEIIRSGRAAERFARWCALSQEGAGAA